MSRVGTGRRTFDIFKVEIKFCLLIFLVIIFGRIFKRKGIIFFLHVDIKV